MSIAKKSSDKDKKMESLNSSPSSAISEHSLIQDVRSYIKELRMSLPQGSPASPFQLPENKEAQPMKGICGQRQLIPFALYNRNMFSWKTCQGSLIPNDLLYTEILWKAKYILLKNGDKLVEIMKFKLHYHPTSDEFLETWPKAGMMQNGECWELTTAEDRTKEKELGFWHTPDTMCGLTWKSQKTMDRESNTTRHGRTEASNLRDQIAVREGIRIWPTPQTQGLKECVNGKTQPLNIWLTPRAGNPGSRPNQKGGKILAEEVKKWPTPQNRDFRIGEGHRWETPEERSRNLNDAVAFETGYKTFPTPTSSMVTEADFIQAKFHSSKRPTYQEAKNFPTPKSRDWKGKTQRGTHKPEDGLCNTLDVTGGQLNPDWVEALMAWPPGWTSLEPLLREVFEHWLNNYQWQDWEPNIPRVAKGIKDRVNRLKAIGNGQVPICVVTAFLLLSGKNKL
jgi:hypothetical protein